jgi:hypothetical protein
MFQLYSSKFRLNYNDYFITIFVKDLSMRAFNSQCSLKVYFWISSFLDILTNIDSISLVGRWK